MSGEPRLFRLEQNGSRLQGLEEVDFSDLDLRERQDIQEWVAANPNILGENLLFVSKEFSGFDLTRERPDLVAVDSGGCLVVVELKRDDSGTDVHWQAIKYAGYLSQARPDDIVEMLAKHEGIEEEQAGRRLSEHVGLDDSLDLLNNDQRIILVSHRFPREVTSAALWLNEKAARPLVTCVTLTPYASDDETLHVLASTIIPVPGDAGLRVGIGARQANERLREQNEIKARNQQDGVTEFLRRVGESARERVSDDMRPDKTSRWAGGNNQERYYHLWYSSAPWGNWSNSYRILLYPEVDEYPEQIEQDWTAWVGFVPTQDVGDRIGLASLEIHKDQEQELEDPGIWVQFEASQLTEDLANRLAEVLARFIRLITPAINDLGNESD